MADVMCRRSFEDLDPLLDDEQLPSELAALFEDSARTIDLSGGYETELTRQERRSAGAAHLRHEPRDAPLGAGPSAGVGQLRATAAGEWPYSSSG